MLDLTHTLRRLDALSDDHLRLMRLGQYQPLMQSPTLVVESLGHVGQRGDVAKGCSAGADLSCPPRGVFLVETRAYRMQRVASAELPRA